MNDDKKVAMVNEKRAKTGAGTAGSYAPHTPSAAEIEIAAAGKPGPKYAPARADGTKAYVQEAYFFGRSTTTIVWARTAAEAKSAGWRGANTRYTARRATPADLAATIE